MDSCLRLYFAELISSLSFLTFVSFLHKGVFEIWDCSKWITDKAQTSFFALNSWNITSELLNLSKKADLEKGFFEFEAFRQDVQSIRHLCWWPATNSKGCVSDLFSYFLMLLNWMKASVSFRGRDLGVSEKEPRLPSDPEAPAQSQIMIHVLAGSSCSVADAHK